MKNQIIKNIVNPSLFLIIAFATGCSSSKDSTDVNVEEILSEAKRKLVFVEGGEFWLGDVGNEQGVPFTPIIDDNRPPKRVEVDGFYILKHEVTWGEFMVFLHDVGRAESYTIDTGFKRAVRLPISSNNDPLSPNFKHKPARSPNYHEAEEYCLWLAEKSGLPYSLPTEAQWEYAARNRGQPIAFATDTGQVEVDKYLQRPSQYIDPMQPVSGNVLIHSSNQVERRPVGSYPSSPLGLYDMTGNVAEWTRDWFHPGYAHLDSTNPVAERPHSEHSNRRVVRDLAGHGDHTGGLATVYARHGEDVNSPDQGFRCVVNNSKPIN